MSLDGFIAKADNTIGHLFDWLNSGDVEFPTINSDITFHLNQTSFDYMQGWVSSLGALVCGRTLFDFTDGWAKAFVTGGSVCQSLTGGRQERADCFVIPAQGFGCGIPLGSE